MMVERAYDFLRAPILYIDIVNEMKDSQSNAAQESFCKLRQYSARNLSS